MKATLSIVIFLTVFLLSCQPFGVYDSFVLIKTRNVHRVVKMYVEVTGRLPPPEVGLDALIRRPTALPESVQWKQLLREVPKDPWGRPYRIVYGDGLPDGFGIYTCGYDGVSHSVGNDPDDWNSWSENGCGIKPALRDHTPAIVGIACGAGLIGFFWGALISRRQRTENAGAGQATTGPEPKSEDGDNPQPETQRRSR